LVKALTDRDWWRTAAVYQVYPRSFADSNGDGIGDLNGVTSRTGYLAALGVDAVWLSPFYPSALADGGYDVDDFRAVDPRIGTLEDFDRMAAALHGAGIRVVVDIVPNHTGAGHRWFREALASPKGSPARDRYIFRDGEGPGGLEPPSDWRASFGGSAWEPTGDGQFYLHSFAPEQPDLNWANPEVRADFLETLRFWADRGADGFRVDVAMMLAKDLSARPLPSALDLERIGPGPNHPFLDRDEVHEIYRE
jgi:alpha-glucosidase